MGRTLQGLWRGHLALSNAIHQRILHGTPSNVVTNRVLFYWFMFLWAYAMLPGHPATTTLGVGLAIFLLGHFLHLAARGRSPRMTSLLQAVAAFCVLAYFAALATIVCHAAGVGPDPGAR